MKILIPARAGSKGIKNKNMTILNGKPLIFYTIQEALKVCPKESIYTSSDSTSILDYAKSLGVNAILRPESLATDESTSSEVIKHFISEIKDDSDDYTILYLQPTSPLRDSSHISEALKIFQLNDCKSVISVSKSKQLPSKTFHLRNNYLETLFKNNTNSEIRQKAELTYYPNGAIYIFNKLNFLSFGKIPDENVLPYIMSNVDSIDIDDNIDLEYVKLLMKNE